MVAKAGGYFGIPLKGYRGVTQVNLLSPMFFNVVVGAVVCLWVTVVVPTQEYMEGPSLSIQDLAAYFYTKYGLVVLNQPKRLQRLFNVLTGLFYRVGLRMNMQKTLSMTFQTFHAYVRMLVEAYERCTTGIGPTFEEQQWSRV